MISSHCATVRATNDRESASDTRSRASAGGRGPGCPAGTGSSRDLPAPQLPPVEHQRARRRLDRRDRRRRARRGAPAEERSELFSDDAEPDHVAADDALPEVGLRSPVDRRRRGLGDQVQHVARDDRPAERVAGVVDEDHAPCARGGGRSARAARRGGGQRAIRPAAAGRRPATRERANSVSARSGCRGAREQHHPLGAGMEIESDRDRPLTPRGRASPGGVRRRLPPPVALTPDLAVDQRYAGEELRAMAREGIRSPGSPPPPPPRARGERYFSCRSSASRSS